MAYFVVGGIFMYTRRGARGVEVIPNYSFWKGLPFLVKVSRTQPSLLLLKLFFFCFRMDFSSPSVHATRKEMAIMDSRQKSIILTCNQILRACAHQPFPVAPPPNCSEPCGGVALCCCSGGACPCSYFYCCWELLSWRGVRRPVTSAETITAVVRPAARTP